MALSPREPAWPPPRPLVRWQTWLVVMTVLIVPFFVPIPIGLRRNVLISALGDRLHIVLPAGITLLLYWKGPLRGRLAAAAVTAVVLGGAIELLQELVGRTALLHDWLLDVMGVGMVVGWVGFRGHGRRAGLALVVALVVTAVAQMWAVPVIMTASADARARFPVIADFEGRLPVRLWGANYDAEKAATPAAASSGERGLQLVSGPSDFWPGAHMRRFPYDWSDYRVLELKVRHRVAGVDSVRFGVRVDDFQSLRDKDWIDEGYWATREWTTVSLEFADRLTRWSHRPFDPTDVDVLVVFLPSPADSVILDIDDIRLR